MEALPKLCGDLQSVLILLLTTMQFCLICLATDIFLRKKQSMPYSAGMIGDHVFVVLIMEETYKYTLHLMAMESVNHKEIVLVMKSQLMLMA